MEIQINNIAELKDFVLNSCLGLNVKTEIINRCLNIAIFSYVSNINELIDIINQNTQNECKKIILGNGTKPETNGN